MKDKLIDAPVDYNCKGCKYYIEGLWCINSVICINNSQKED